MPNEHNLENIKALQAEVEKTEKQIKYYSDREKRLLRETIPRLTRNERTHCLCTHGAMLERFLQEPGLLTDGDVMELLSFLFNSEAAQKKLTSMIEARKETRETDDV